MVEANRNHKLIVANRLVLLYNKLHRHGCEVYSNDRRVRIRVGLKNTPPIASLGIEMATAVLYNKIAWPDEILARGWPVVYSTIT